MRENSVPFARSRWVEVKEGVEDALQTMKHPLFREEPTRVGLRITTKMEMKYLKEITAGAKIVLGDELYQLLCVFFLLAMT